MHARTAGPEWSGPVRGPDIFWSGFFRSGPWSGFFGPDFFGPVRGPDFSVRIFIGPVRVRIFGTDNPDRYGLSGPVRNRSGFFYFSKIRTGPNL